ncbi:MAG: hypothetical protein GXP28_02195 [Planctomycetes bacterium]|nr:hypothetical protein [Planctomycetota bacterium]
MASTMALNQGRLFRTLNFETPDPQAALAITTDDQQPSGDSFLKLSVTPQAQAVAVVVTRGD